MDSDDLIIGCGAVLFVAIGIAAIFIADAITENINCSNKWNSFSHRYNYFSGCQIEVGGKWIPSESYYFKEE